MGKRDTEQDRMLCPDCQQPMYQRVMVEIRIPLGLPIRNMQDLKSGTLVGIDPDQSIMLECSCVVGFPEGRVRRPKTFVQDQVAEVEEEQDEP